MHVISRARLAGPAALLTTSLLTTSFLLPASAFAHEHRDDVAGKYTLVVGWQNEPAYVGQANAATVRLTQAGADPTERAAQTASDLHLQLNQDGMLTELPLLAVDGKPGMYTAEVLPDRVGDVRWSISGTVDGNPIQEVFTSADGKFDAVSANPVAADTDRLSDTLDLLDRSGLHDLDMSLQGGGSLPDGAAERIHAIDVAFATTSWPAALQDDASHLLTQLDLLHTALDANDMSTAAQAAHAAHEESHAFSNQARAYLQSSAGGTPSSKTAATSSDMSHMNMPGMAEDNH
jgi:hypothetical protein